MPGELAVAAHAHRQRIMAEYGEAMIAQWQAYHGNAPKDVIAAAEHATYEAGQRAKEVATLLPKE